MKHSKGIIFQADNVIALIAGTKQQTRRMVKLTEFGESNTDGYDWHFRDRRSVWNDFHNDRIAERCPYGKPGTELHVKEAFAIVPMLSGADRQYGDQGVRYRATWTKTHSGRWLSPLHMPRACSRITLKLTDVRVQRVQAITEDDAKAEGVPPFFERYDRIGKDQRIACGDEENFLAVDFPHRASYACMWDEINGDTALWSANPCVWALTFEVMQ